MAISFGLHLPKETAGKKSTGALKGKYVCFGTGAVLVGKYRAREQGKYDKGCANMSKIKVHHSLRGCIPKFGGGTNPGQGLHWVPTTIETMGENGTTNVYPRETRRNSETDVHHFGTSI